MYYKYMYYKYLCIHVVCSVNPKGTMNVTFSFLTSWACLSTNLNHLFPTIQKIELSVIWWGYGFGIRLNSMELIQLKANIWSSSWWSRSGQSGSGVAKLSIMRWGPIQTVFKLCPLVSVVTRRECHNDKYFILHDKIIFQSGHHHL